MLNNTYTTVSGDTWDIVAYKAYGNECIWILLLRRILSIKIPIFFRQGLY